MNICHYLKVGVLVSLGMVSGCTIGNDEHSSSTVHGKVLDVAPVSHQGYRDECGSCHMAYQPGFLPQRSWVKIMGNLEDHFGESAEIDGPVQQQLRGYLMDNAADHSDYKRSKAIVRSLAYNEAPLKISETRYFLRKHDELPIQLVQQNPEVESFSRCEVCHTEADKGSYDEDRVRIPGYGQWDD